MSTNLPANVEPALWDRLTERERKFATHPEVMTDIKKAAVEAGYTEGWARHHAHVKRKQLMYYILPVSHQRMLKAGITLDRIYEELACVAFADETEFYDRVQIEGYNDEVLMGRDPTLMPEQQRRAIQQLHFDTLELSDGTKIQRTSFTLHDKKPALKMLAEMLGGFDPRTREPGDAAEKRKQAELFEFMTSDEIETITKIYRRAEKKQRLAATDATIIEGKQ